MGDLPKTESLIELSRIVGKDPLLVSVDEIRFLQDHVREAILDDLERDAEDSRSGGDS